MVNRALYFCSGARHFRLQRDDARFQFLDRQRVKVLYDQRGERIARAFRENLVEVHRQDR